MNRRRPWLLLGLLLAVVLAADLWWLRRWWRGRLEQRAEPHLRAAARRYGVEPALLKAVAWRESGFDPDARGAAGELGLMQVGELAAQEWADAEQIPGYDHLQLLDPGTNALAGAWYLRKVMQRYRATDDPVAYGLADYNAGRTHVLRWLKGPGATNSAAFLEQMDFPGTRAYVQTIRQQLAGYRARSWK
jgi:soluble lytic murein transglycosylase